jgi:hypothetical protein
MYLCGCVLIGLANGANEYDGRRIHFCFLLPVYVVLVLSPGHKKHFVPKSCNENSIRT